jgi:hypothetical protein
MKTFQIDVDKINYSSNYNKLIAVIYFSRITSKTPAIFKTLNNPHSTFEAILWFSHG